MGRTGNMKIRIHFNLLSYIFAFTLTSCIAISSWAGEIKVGTWKTAQTIQPFYYQKFMSPGQKVSVFSFTNPADQKMALLAGSLDMCGTTLAHAIHSVSRGQPVVLVAALCNKCSALVVRKDGPIRTPRDLAGKNIGYVPGTMHEILLREVLTRYGLSPDKDVHLTRVDFFDMGMALARGGIDAFLSGEPFPTMAVVKGYGRILSYPYFGGTIGTINAGMLVRRETIRKHPELVFSLSLAHARATNYLKKHQDEWLKRASGFGTPLPILEKAAPNMELAWKMDEQFVKRTRALGARMKALGVIEREPDYSMLFDLSFVRKVRESLGE
jgi:NitT/TauT family transport system substrate-binding protein